MSIEEPAASARIGYARARLILLGFGLAFLLAIAGIMYVRSVQTDEVIGVLLFILVFIGLVFWGVGGGAVAAVLASAVYVAIRYSAIQTLGWGEMSGLIATRVGAYLLFGFLGGWANRQLEASLTKLELYDQVDDATGLLNARFFLQDTDLEISRSGRYQTVFGVALVDIPASALEPLSRRQRSGLLKEVGRTLKDSVRTVDRAVHGRDKDRHRIAVVLPETGKEGARIFTERLSEQLARYLQGRGVTIAGGRLESAALAYPGDEEALGNLRREFADIDRAEHPEEEKTLEKRA